MANIELVIKIPEEAYKLLKNEGVDWLGAEHILNAVANGIPLPKGHGALKDSDLLDTRLNFVLNHTGGYKNTPIGTGIVIAMAENLDAKTIIEADKEQKDGNI